MSENETLRTKHDEAIERKLRQGIEGLRAYVASFPTDWYASVAWACPLSRWLSSDGMTVSVNYVGTLLLVQGVDVDVEVLLTGMWADFVRQFDAWAGMRHITTETLLHWLDQIYAGG